MDRMENGLDIVHVDRVGTAGLHAEWSNLAFSISQSETNTKFIKLLPSEVRKKKKSNRFRTPNFLALFSDPDIKKSDCCSSQEKGRNRHHPPFQHHAHQLLSNGQWRPHVRSK